MVITVADATEQLQQRYVGSRFSSSVDEWPPYQPKHYTTLAFIHNKGNFTDAVRFFVAQELAVAGNINTTQLHNYANLKANMTTNISDIFLPIMASDGSFIDLHILIEGAPGIGKTVLAKEIAYQWAKNELLASKKLLLLVFLRECHQKTMMSIEDLIQFVFRNSEVTSCVTKYLTKTEGKDTVIIFDGFDELSEENRKRSIIVDIFNRIILSKCCLVVTSRPTASSILHESVDRRVEIVGFTEEDRLEYIQTALENHEQVEALQHYLQSNPTINALCYIPLNMTILLCLVEDAINRLPKTQTEMYKRFIETTIIRYIKKFENRDIIINIAELPHPYDKLLKELARLAYKALNTDKIVFTLSEINKDCPNLTMTSSNWNGLGLLKAVQCYSKKIGNDQVTFHFLHFSIQEYMAAWYISKLSNSKQIKLLQNTFWEQRYYTTWIMYVGITGGCSFALRHFMSGNRFQLYSKVFGASKVSSKFLKHKMKCLHLFQCLVEVDKVDSMKQLDSVKELFQNNQIDLSNQTLLPSDLNTLGFFLIRSINKEWDELNLSNCSIGSNGSNVLCDRLLDKDVRCIITIKTVNFSYNQLDFSSLIRLFGLFNSWHTSEIIITDDVSLGKTTDQKIEDIVLQSSTLVLVHITSWLFCKNAELSKIRHILSNTTNIESVYFLNCTWTYDSEVLALLRKQKLNKVRIIGSFNLRVIGLFFENNLIKTLASILLNSNDSVNTFVYSPTMPDQIADDISNLVLSSNKDISGVMLIVSSSKIQGMVNTCSLSNELSALEIFNLSRYIRHLNTKMCLWSLENNSRNKDVVFTFIKLLHKTDFDWKLKVLLWENNTLIVHNAKFKSFDKFKQFTNNNIYLSNCDFDEVQYDIISGTCSTLHILNSPECIEMLHAKLSHKQSVPNELFVYGNIEYDLMNSLIELLSHDHVNISAVLAANGIMVGIHPTSELIALAFQLQPLPITWILSTTDNRSVFYQVIDAISIIPDWIELDFTGCDIGDVDCEVVQRTFKSNNCSTVRKLNISFNKLSVSGIQDLTKIVLIWRVQQLNINGTNDALLYCLIKNLTCKHQNSFFVSITYNHKIFLVVCSKSWYEIATKMNTHASELHIINCDLLLNTTGFIDYLHTVHNVLRLCISNGDVECEIMYRNLRLNNYSTVRKVNISLNKLSVSGISDLVEIILLWRVQELNINESNNVLHNCLVKKLAKEHHRFSFLSITYNHKVIVYNTGWDKIATILNGQVSELYVINCILYSKELISFLETTHSLLRFCLIKGHISVVILIEILKLDKVIEVSISNAKIIDDDRIRNLITQTKFYLGIKSSLMVSTSKWLCVHNITKYQLPLIHQYFMSQAHSDCYGMNLVRKLEQINGDKMYVFDNNLLTVVRIHAGVPQAAGATQIITALSDIVSLHTIEIDNYAITNETVHNLANILHNNTQLQELYLNGNCLHADNTIAKMLHSISTSSVCKNHTTNDVARNFTVTEISITSAANLEASDSTTTIKAESLHSTRTLTKFSISNNRITDKVANDISAVISNNIHLQEVNLGYNNLQASGIIKIAGSLQKISSLTKLYINHNSIFHEAADDIAAVISCNTSLQEINVSKNHLQIIGAKKIAKALGKISALENLNLSNNNITAEAADDIAAVISCNTSLKEIDVSINNLQTIGAKKIVKALGKISALQKLNLSNINITGEAADDIAAVISCNTSLQEIDVSRNHLQTIGAKKIAKALGKIFALEKLNFSNNNITGEAADDFAAVISCNTNLQEIDVSRNHLQTIGAKKIVKALRKISALEKLNLSNNNITGEAADDIMNAIFFNAKLQEIDISENNLLTAGVKKIMNTLQGINTLRKLCLSDNNITSEAADDIAAVVCCNTSLQEIDVSRNNLQTIGAIKIAKALGKISALEKLNLSNNNITGEAADDIADVIYNTKLQEIDISENYLLTAGVQKIMKALQGINTLRKLCLGNNNITGKVANDIAAVISCNTSLWQIDISRYNLQTSGAIKIAKALRKNCALEKLNVSNNNITGEAADDIAAVISCNTSLQEIDASRNNLQIRGVKKITKALGKSFALEKLNLSNNNITGEAADDIAAVISSNTKLQEIDISENNLLTVGVQKIMKALQGINSLKKLCLGNNNITGEAADDIAVAVSCNTGLQEIDASRNNLQTIGAKKIAKALGKISALQKLNLSNNNITGEAADDIAAAISSNTKLQEIDISENSFLTADVRKIVKALQGINTLRKLCLRNNNITGEAADDIAAVISCNTSLQDIDVSRNHLQTIGAKKIAKALGNIYALEKLNLSNNNIIGEAADDIADAIFFNTKLQEIDISENNLLTAGVGKIIEALQGIYSLKKLCLSNNNITGKAADDIAAVISCNTSLQEIDVSGNDLQTSDVKKIVKALGKIQVLKKLNLSNNNITAEATYDIGMSISCNTSLKEIDVSGNHLQTRGAIKITKALRKISALEKLNLSNNNITGEAADDIVAAISCNTKLQEFNISDNNLLTAGVRKIIKALQGVLTLRKLCLSNNNITGKVANDIAAVISCNTSLQQIDISRNNLQTSGAVNIAKALRKNCALEKLNVSNNNITGEAADDIAAVISCNTSLQEIDASQNNLQTRGAKKISKALEKISALEKLNLSNNNITGEAADDIAAVISSNTKLQEIDISENNLLTAGAQKIMKALQGINSLKKLCLGNNNITGEAADDIAAAVSCNTSLQEIDISRNDLQTKGIMKIVIALQQTYGVTKLCLSNNNITNKAGDDIAKVISHNIHLREFHISGNKLLTIGAIKIAKALKHVFSLKALYISDNEIDSRAAHDIATAISHANQLHELDISKNNFKARGIEIILKPLQGCDQLTKLYINDNNVTDDKITHDVGTVISCNTGLQEVDISGNNLQARGAINVAVALQSIVMLTKLCINNNSITYHAANDIAIAITCNIHLQHLSIGGNNLLAIGATIIAKSLQKISTLTKLYINNSKITSAAADDIAAAVSCNTKLQEIDISDNYFLTAGVQKIMKALQGINTLRKLCLSKNNITGEAADDIAAVVSCNPHLEEFDISKNQIEGRSAIKLAKSFQKISLLKKLFVDHNRITDEATDDFASVISHNPHLIAFKINGNFLRNVKRKIIKAAFYANRNLTEIDI